MRFERDSRQSLAQARERYPTAIYQYHATVRAVQGSQNLVAGATLVASVVQEELVIGIELADHAYSLEPRYLIEAPRSQWNDLLRTGREAIVFSLPELAPSPLPASQVDERHAQDNRQDSEIP